MPFLCVISVSCTLSCVSHTCHCYLYIPLCMCSPVHAVQRRAIVTVFDDHRQELEVTSLTSDLKDMGILTAEQCQKLVSLDDKERRHEALLYTLLASERPDTFHKLVGCIELRDSSAAADLQSVLVYWLVGSISTLVLCNLYCPCSLQPPSRVWWNPLVHCLSSAALSVRCHL